MRNARMRCVPQLGSLTARSAAMPHASRYRDCPLSLLRTLIAVAGAAITITDTSIAITSTDIAITSAVIGIFGTDIVTTSAVIGIIGTYSSPRASASAAPRCPTPEPTGRHLPQQRVVGTAASVQLYWLCCRTACICPAGRQCKRTPRHREKSPTVQNAHSATYKRTAYDVQHTHARHTQRLPYGTPWSVKSGLWRPPADYRAC